MSRTTASINYQKQFTTLEHNHTLWNVLHDQCVGENTQRMNAQRRETN